MSEKRGEYLGSTRGHWADAETKARKLMLDVGSIDF